MFRTSCFRRLVGVQLPAILFGLMWNASTARAAGAADGKPAAKISAKEPTTPTETVAPVAPPDIPSLTGEEPPVQPEFPPEIRDDPGLSEEERGRRHAQRLQFLLEQRARQKAAIEPEPEARVAIERPSFGNAVAGYLHDRVLDFCDFFRARIHVPRGFRSIGLKVRGTVLAQAGFIYFHGQSAGLDRRGVGIWREKRIEGGVGPAYVSKTQNEMIAGNRFTDVDYAWSVLHHRGIVRNGFAWDDGRHHPFSCGAELQLFFFGIELETYPLEYLDAVFGFLGLDSYQDDETRVLRRWMEIQRVPELHVSTEWVNTMVEEPPKEGDVPEKPPEKPQP